MPLTMRREYSPLGVIRRLGFPLDNWGTAYGPLGSQPAETYAAAFRHLHASRHDWDVIDLRWIPAEQSTAVIAAWHEAGMHFQQKPWNRTAQIDLAAGWDVYWNSRTSKWRNNQRRCDKQLAKSGSVRVEHFRPEPGCNDPRWNLFDACEQIAAKSWQGASTSGNTLTHPTVRAFLRDVHDAATSLGCVHMTVLFVNERPAAFTYNYVANQVTIGLRMGYDMDFQAAGAGSVVMRETIRECCTRGDLTFDLGESPSPYKRHFSTGNVDSFRFCHYSTASPIAYALRLKGWLTSANPQ
jgi:CelD/BcsL family acetyltransferase involved in cellulose biosynthesis